MPKVGALVLERAAGGAGGRPSAAGGRISGSAWPPGIERDKQRASMGLLR